jgi:hypothetical protein
VISFRKHAQESTRRPNSLLTTAMRGLRAAMLLSLLLVAATQSATAATGQKRHAPKKDAAVTESPGAVDAKIPVRVKRYETADGPVIAATIGDFPRDLNEVGQEFLSREFFAHFASDVLGLDESDPKASTLKVMMLPQEKENRREGDFIFGKVSGHIVVLVEKRRVFVACTFSKAARAPGMLARAGRFVVVAGA